MTRRVFVFGSNLAGRHGAGAALYARQLYGAQYGVGEGMTGESYALPTMDEHIRPRALADVAGSVRAFMRWAEKTPNVEYEVTKVGCGLAGFAESQIIPLFAGSPSNCHLPDGWRTANGEPEDA